MELKQKHAPLIQKITDGLKDDYLDILQKNADEKICYAVWKAVEERRKTIRLEKKGIVEPSYEAPEISDWIKLGSHTALDKPCIESVGRMLNELLIRYPNCFDIETFLLANIRCDTLQVQAGSASCEAYTEIGEDKNHTMTFIAGKTTEDVPYWRVLISSTIKNIGVTYDTEEEAIKSTFEVIRDECLL